jgi:hypothetical protein
VRLHGGGAQSGQQVIGLGVAVFTSCGRKGVIVAGHDEMAFGPVVAELKALLERCAEIRPVSLTSPITSPCWPVCVGRPCPRSSRQSERPDEPVTTGVEVDRSGPQTLEELIALVAAKYREEQGHGDQSIRDAGK